jgi:hypothetical protein
VSAYSEWGDPAMAQIAANSGRALHRLTTVVDVVVEMAAR